MAALNADRAQLRDSLLAALAFFDLFDYPLTLSEIRRYRYGPAGEDVSVAELAAAVDPAAVEEREGYFFLKGRAEIVGTRQRRYRLAERKFLKARRFAAWARLLPSVRLVAVCNSLALSNADTGSDIDLFIVCRPGTLWATRLILAGALQLLGLRPRPGREADTFCLSFFLSEEKLDASGLALPGGDVYLLYWIAALVPVYDAGGVLEAFVSANGWVRQRLPGFAARETGRRRRSPGVAANSWFLAPLRLFDAPAAKFQQRRFPAEIRSLANVDSRVVVSADILKLHVIDRRARFQELFEKKLAGLGIVI